MVGRPNEAPRAQHAGGRIFQGFARLLVEDPKYFGQRAAGRASSGPTGQSLRDGIHERDARPRVRRDHGVADARERDGVAALAIAQLTFCGVFMQSHLDRRAQLRIFERLQDVTERLGQARAGQRLVVGVRGQVDHGYLRGLPDSLGGLDAVHLALEANVHQHQIGRGLACELHGAFTVGGDPHHRVTNPRELLLDVAGDDAVILDDQDLGGCHAFEIPGKACVVPRDARESCDCRRAIGPNLNAKSRLAQGWSEWPGAGQERRPGWLEMSQASSAAAARRVGEFRPCERNESLGRDRERGCSSSRIHRARPRSFVLERIAHASHRLAANACNIAGPFFTWPTYC